MRIDSTMTGPARLVGLAALLLVSGCQLDLAGSDRDANGDDNDNGNGGGTTALSVITPTQPHGGVLGAGLTVTAIHLERDGGERERLPLDPPVSVELVRAQRAEAAPRLLLDGASVPAGEYARVELEVDANASQVSSLTGGVVPLEPASERLVMDTDFTLQSGTEELVVQPALHAALQQNDDGGFRLEDDHLVTTSRASGRVFLPASGSAACFQPSATGLYFFDGFDREPAELGAADGPVFTFRVGNLAALELGFLPAGDYTVAWTCEADRDGRSDGDGIEFIGRENLEVEAGACSAVELDGGTGRPGTC